MNLLLWCWIMIIVKQINTDNSGVKIRSYAELVASSL